MIFLRNLLIFSLFIYPNQVQGQEFYFFSKRFDIKTQILLDQNGFNKIDILTVGNIDPSRRNSVDEDRVKEFLMKNFNTFDTYYLVIDWEEEGYQDLRHQEQTSDRFIAAETEYLKLIDIVKEYNAKIHVGIYGIPFRLPVNKKANINTGKYDFLLSKVDFISPSFYTMHPVREVGVKVNREYFQQNLRQALSYSVRLNKPVYPFIWELVHPDNIEYGGTLISDEELFSNLEFLLSYKFLDRKINGVIWWSPSVISPEYSRFNHEKVLSVKTNIDSRSLYIRSRIQLIKSKLNK